MKKQYSETTAQGYEVLASYGDNCEYTIIYRPSAKDYLVAWLYDENTGTWSQGHYCFKSFADCEKWIFTESNLKQRYLYETGLNQYQNCFE